MRTPESIAFAYELAGLGSRFLAVFIDGMLQGILAFALIFGLAYAASRLPRGMAQPSHFVQSVAVALFFFALFAIFFGYFILFEVFWNGQTPGKRALGIRVVRDGGYAVDFAASLVRNVIRIVEGTLCMYLIAAVSALASRENKRIGDFAAGTIVVRDARLVPPDELLRERTPEYAATAILPGEERELVHRFIERRDSLPSERRAELAAALAARIRPRVGADLRGLDDESLLERL